MTSPETSQQNYIRQGVKERIQEAKNKKLKQLDLSSTALTEVPSNVWELEQLEVLNLSHNKLTSLPESIGNLSNLTKLNLGGNQLTNLPESIGNLSDLTELNLGGNQLTNLPESIGNLSDLTMLNLSRNQLTSLPESIGEISNLTMFYLGGNQLISIPESMGKISNLTRLYLGCNQLKDLPKSIGKLSNLKTLNLFSNELIILPEFIRKLSNLTALNLGNNQLKDLPQFINKLSRLKTLILLNNQLIILPKSIGKLSNLKTLNLFENKLITLPESISKLSNLTTLYLGNNQLKILPKSISKLSNLTKLFLSSSQLTILPESISRLSNLTQFYLSDNPFTNRQIKIPTQGIKEIIESFQQMQERIQEAKDKRLKELDLSGSYFIRLVDIPIELWDLEQLEILKLSNNQLTSLPESISRLSHLTELDLRWNQLTSLPESITKLSNLTRLYLENNPLETPPIEIATKGIQEIRNYFQQEREKGIDYIYEAKLLIVGEAGAGKTTLANKIINQNYQLKDEDTTKGIEVYHYEFQIKNQNDFQVNIWDFGGQEIYHATHQFFLTKRSLYILVADTRKEDTDFYYWLNVVELLSDNSPLLIVKNEKQERQREINQRVLQGQFTNIKEILATNLATNRGLEEIIGEIEHHISKLPHIGSSLPKPWKKVREALESEPRNYISLEEYLSICEQNGFTKREYKLQLSGYLHDLGICLHFQDDPLLNKTVILKPEWGTAAVYKALDNPKVYNNFGKFTKDDLTNIWNEEKYLNMRDELLQLMIRFKLCYKISGNSQTYIAPQLLTENQPEYDWDESNNLILRYTYTFMPKGIITQFIVVMHKHIEEQKYVWKSGVILKMNETKAEVIEYYNIREIKIRVSGREKRDLMTIVTHELDKIHSSYNNRLKYNQLIPCNCATCKNSQDPHFYKREKLKERISNGRPKIECGNYPYYEVNINSLIDDVIDIDYENKPSESHRDRNKINEINFIGSRIEMNHPLVDNKTMNQQIDQSQKIQNQAGNITGNVLGDKSNIEGQITTNDPTPKRESSHEFGWQDFLTSMQNRQIIYYLISAIIGICLLMIYPKLFPSGFRKLIEKIPEIFPTPQVEIKSDQNQ